MGLVTTGRQDWGILRSTCAWLKASEAHDVRVFAGGMACSDRYGRNERLMAAEGFAPDERLSWLDDTGEGSLHPAQEAGRAVSMFGDAFSRHDLGAVVLAGDRYETLAAALAATLLGVPIVHLHGGEETEGAFDNAIRHAVTKLSHLHLVSHATYAKRVIAMGEDPATIHVVGAPALDNLERSDLATRAELEETLGKRLDAPVVVVTVHPATLAAETLADVTATCAAMREVPASYVITLPNSDPGNDAIRQRLLEVAKGTGAVAVESLGERRYWGLLRIADAVLGNSSSGVIEAPALHVPTVNVGERQRGRLRGPGVLDVASLPALVTAALRKALAPSFREHVRTQPPPFAQGRAADRIGAVLSAWTPPRPPVKSPIVVAA